MSAQPSDLRPSSTHARPDPEERRGIDRSDLSFDYLEALRVDRSPRNVTRIFVTIVLQIVVLRVIVHVIFFPFTVGEWIAEGVVTLVSIFVFTVMWMIGKAARDRQIEEVFDLETEMAKREEEEERGRARRRSAP